jgi:hypothetical protein
MLIVEFDFLTVVTTKKVNINFFRYLLIKDYTMKEYGRVEV